VFVGLGDNQASFIGSGGQRAGTVVVNVGTGAQVGRVVEQVYYAPPLETRPFPRGGYLLVNAGLAGGRIYALLERFFRQVGSDVLGTGEQAPVYETMNALAAQTPAGADGLRCEPTFMGSRADPTRRGAWSGMTDRNFTPAHLTRALLEGMARSYREGFDLVQATSGLDCTRLVGAGNGLRENPLLASLVAEQFGMPLAVPAHREEAAYGAALVAGVGAGVWPSLQAASQAIRYEGIVLTEVTRSG
jgi:sugar (pentulose or hexulose) kinase